MWNKGPQPSGNSQLQTGRIAPVLEFVGQEFHGHSFILFEGLLQHIQGKLAKLSAMTQWWAANIKAGRSARNDQKGYLRDSEKTRRKEAAVQCRSYFKRDCSSENGLFSLSWRNRPRGFPPRVPELLLRSDSTPQNKLCMAPWQVLMKNSCQKRLFKIKLAFKEKLWKPLTPIFFFFKILQNTQMT